MTSDRVGDFITRLMNAGRVHKRTARMPYSTYLHAIAKKLSQLGYVGPVTTAQEEGSPKKELVVELLYSERGAPRIQGTKRVSKPGRRLYVSHREAHGVKRGQGARLISTSRGVLTDAEARKVRAGGENLFEIW